MVDDRKPGPEPDFQAPALALAKEVALEPSIKAKEEFEAGLPGRMLSHATLLAKSTGAYLVALGALYGMAWWLFGKQLVFLMEAARPWPQLLLIAFPLAIVGIPLAWDFQERRKRRHLEALAVSTEQYMPGFFRLDPYEEADGSSFARADRAHERVLSWLLDSGLPPFRYLTGASGAGKTSLLQAYVFPKLREKGWFILSLRSREDGVARLRQALLREGAIWRSPPDVTGARELLERAVATLRRNERQLLLVVDQFEELFILESEASLGRSIPENDTRITIAREAFIGLLRDLSDRPIEGLIVLLSLRKDYEDKIVEKYDLPPFRQNENRRSIDLFDVPAALAFLRASGTSASNEVLRAVLESAGRVEDREGLFRPVLLNLVGLQLVRSNGILPCPPEKIVSHFLLSSLHRQETRDIAKLLFQPLVTDHGTARVRSLEELANATGKTRLEIKGVLRTLREDGLVRPLDEIEETWQVAHDFLARQIGLLFGRLKGPGWRLAGLWAPPILLLCLMAILGVAPWWAKIRAHAELRQLGASVSGSDNKIIINYSGREWSRLAKSAHLVNVRFLYLGVMTPVLDLKEVADLTTLEELSISFPLLAVDSPPRGNVENLEVVADLPNLVRLQVFNYRLDNLEPIRGLTRLETLSLTRTNTTNIDAVTSLKSLATLVISNGDLADSSPLGGLPALKHLSLSNTRITSIESLSQLGLLESLDLSSTDVKNIEALSAFNNLISLNLNSTKLESIEPLRELRSLEYLQLKQTNTIGSLEPLANLPSLRLVEVSRGEMLESDLERLSDRGVIVQMSEPESSKGRGSVSPNLRSDDAVQ